MQYNDYKDTYVEIQTDIEITDETDDIDEI